MIIVPGGDKWRHVQVSDDDTVDQTNHCTDGADNQDHHENGHGRHFREHLVGVFHRLQQGCRDHRREANRALRKGQSPVTMSPATPSAMIIRTED